MPVSWDVKDGRKTVGSRDGVGRLQMALYQDGCCVYHLEIVGPP